MTRAAFIDLTILALTVLWALYAFPAKLQEYRDAELHYAVDQAFVAHGVRVER